MSGSGALTVAGRPLGEDFASEWRDETPGDRLEGTWLGNKIHGFSLNWRVCCKNVLFVLSTTALVFSTGRAFSRGSALPVRNRACAAIREPARCSCVVLSCLSVRRALEHRRQARRSWRSSRATRTRASTSSERVDGVFSKKEIRADAPSPRARAFVKFRLARGAGARRGRAAPRTRANGSRTRARRDASWRRISRER